MAEVVAISLQVDSGQSVQEVKKLEDAIKDVQKTTNSSNVEEKFNSLNQAIDRGEGSVEDLRKAIKSYQTIALSAGRESPIGQEALKRSADLKDKLTDLDNEVNRLSQDGKNLQGALQIGQSAVAGYQAMTSITALLGVENEELMKTMVKLQATMSLLQSIEQIRLATEKESQAMLFIKNAQTKIAIGLQKAYALAVGTGSKALKGLRTALLATGVGAIIVALGTIVAYWDDIKGAVSGLSKEQKKRNSDLEKQKELTKSQLDNIIASENTLRLAGKSEEDILKMKLQKLDAQLAEQRLTIENAEVQKKLQIEASKRNRDILQGIIAFITAPLTMLLGTVDAITYGLSFIPGLGDIATNLADDFTKGVAELVFNPEEVEKEGQDTIDEAKAKLVELQNTRDGFTLAEQEKRKVASNKAIEEKKQEDEKTAKLEEEKLAKLKELKQEFTDLQNQEIEDENQRAITQLETEQKRELDALIKKYGENTELEKQLKINQALEMDALEESQRLAKEQKLKENQAIINEILKQFDLDAIENTFERARQELEIQKNLDLEKLKSAEATQEEIDKLNKVYSEKSKKLAEEETEFKKKLKKQEVDQALKATSDVLGSIVSLVGEGSQVGKAAAIAQATIDTYTAANAAYSSVVGVPIVGPALAPIAAGVAVASGLANIRKIISTKIPGGGMSGGSGVSAPSIPSVPTTVTSGTAPTGNNTGNGRTEIPTTKVVLVESELQAMQSRRSQVDRIATI